MKGWILDCYPDYEHGCMIIWLKTEHGIERLVDRHFVPSFFVRAPEDRLRELVGSLRTVDVHDTSLEMHTTLMRPEPAPFLKVTVDDYGSLSQIAKMVDAWGHYRDYELYNVDLRYDQRYFLEHDIFPMGLLEVDTEFRMLDSQERILYPIPELSAVELKVEVSASRGIPVMDDPVQSISVGDLLLDGAEEGILEDLVDLVKERDPDIIYTEGGDAFYMEYLAQRAQRYGIDMDLGREAGFRKAKGKSYFTYGRIMYKPPAHKLRGRVHLDTDGSITYSQSGIYGLIDIARLCLIPMQDLARLSPGSAISAMQVNQAMRDGHLVLWKKNLPEDFKTASTLLLSDRGGFIYEPEVGLHENIVEVDFASLYPSIIVHHNISPETLNCPCCPTSAKVVPGIGYWTCEKRLGLLPRVLDPVIKRRLELKRMIKANAPGKDIFEQRSQLLKWILVTCFGYTGYRNARFGRIECHESINAYGREIMLQASGMAEERGYRVLHGIVDSLWLEGGDGDPEDFCRAVQEEVGIPLHLEGTYKWLVFLPSISTGVGALNRYYGLFESGELKLRGIFLRKGDTTELARDLQNEMLAVFCKACNADQFRALIPAALEVMDAYVERLADGEVPLEKLIIRHRVSKEVEEYTQFNDSFAALKQLQERGFPVPPGRAVEYVVCDGESKSVWQRVKAAAFLDGSERYDADEYTDLLMRASADLLLPFGWSFEALQERARKLSRPANPAWEGEALGRTG